MKLQKLSSKKRVMLIRISWFILPIVIVYVFLNYTQSGRLLALYAFGGLGAPFSVKVDCAKETNSRVENKFLLPLNFDEGAKNALKEYWHFSYYRECLFNNGYDFDGRAFSSSEIVDDVYINHFGGFSFSVPPQTEIIVDNETNPDIEDRLISSKLEMEGQVLNVLIYRSYDDVSLETLEGFVLVREDGMVVQVFGNGELVPEGIVDSLRFIESM